MKKLVVALAIVVLLLSAQISQAADLREGWYVKLGGVAIYGVIPQTGQPVGLGWHFTAPVGQYGPFLVDQPDSTWAQLVVSVTQDVFGVPYGTGVNICLQPEAPIDFWVQSVYFGCDTFYDATQMRLDLFINRADGRSDLIWAQTISGPVVGGPEIPLYCHSFGSADTLSFRIAAVPEVSSLFAILFFSVPFLLQRARISR